MLLKNQSNPIKIFYRTIVTLFSSPPKKMFKSHFILKIVCFFICICQAKIITFQKYIYFSKAIQIIEISFKKQESWTNSETKDSASLFNVNCHFLACEKPLYLTLYMSASKMADSTKYVYVHQFTVGTHVLYVLKYMTIIYEWKIQMYKQK